MKTKKIICTAICIVMAATMLFALASCGAPYDSDTVIIADEFTESGTSSTVRITGDKKFRRITNVAPNTPKTFLTKYDYEEFSQVIKKSLPEDKYELAFTKDELGGEEVVKSVHIREKATGAQFYIVMNNTDYSDRKKGYTEYYIQNMFANLAETNTAGYGYENAVLIPKHYFADGKDTVYYLYEGMKYIVNCTFDELAAFYEAYPCYKVERGDNALTVTVNDEAYANTDTPLLYDREMMTGFTVKFMTKTSNESTTCAVVYSVIGSEWK